MREGCAWVAERARWVRIAGDPFAYAEELLGGRYEPPPVEWDRETHFAGDEHDTVAFVVTLDAINFGSGYFPHLHKRPGLSGYFTIASALKERFERHGPFSAGELRALTPAALADLFGQPPGDPLRDELLTHFCQALVELGRFLDQRFGGSFTRLLGSAHGSAERLAEMLSVMPYFHDVAPYEGRRVPLMKRAQITPSDLALALQGSGGGEFYDLDRLTIFADNLVPHVLRCDGLLEYAPRLAEKLASGEHLPSGSAEEVEIRAVALHAVELMVAAQSSSGRRVSARQMDLLLWNRGQGERYRGGSKHRTRTVFY